MNEIIFKDLKLNTDLKVCFISNEEIKLTKNEYNLLEFLLKNQNKIYSRRELLNAIGSYKSTLRTIDATVSRLRKKLKYLGRYLITRLGFGYGIVK